MDFTGLFDYINPIQSNLYCKNTADRTHQNVWQRVSGKSTTGKEKGGLKEGERWPKTWTPKIYDSSPPLFGSGVINLSSRPKL